MNTPNSLIERIVNNYKKKFGLCGEDGTCDCKREEKFIRKSLLETQQEARREVYEACREVFINEVDWSEWGVTDKEAGERFDEALQIINELLNNSKS